MKKIATLPILFFTGLLLIMIFVFKPYYDFVTKKLSISPVRALISKDSLKTFDGRVNILLLGIAGQDHDGPNLSDSIIVVSYEIQTNNLTTISVPRDIWSATLRDKINSAYAYGEAKKPGAGGFILAKSEVSSIVGFPIHYGAAIDFDRFEELIDFLGGIEVDVKRSFTDKKFPIKGRENDECNGDKEFKCRYETVSFTKGKTVMDGKTALKFVRSRYSEGPEGSDFAREARQQKVMVAVKNNVISYIKKPSVKRYSDLYSLLNNLVKRDMTNQQVAVVSKNFVLNGGFKMEEITLPKELLVNPDISDKYDYRWILTPRIGNFDEIHKYIKNKLEDESESNH